MANQEQLDILKQGVEAWNRWRKEHSDIKPDFSNGMFFGEIDLFRDVELTRSNFRGADLNGVDFRGANLEEAIFDGADLRLADFTKVNLTRANLYGTRLLGADFSGANLRKADLSGAQFIRSKIAGADFSQAAMQITIFNEVDLSEVKGLDTVQHRGPSSISIDTIYLSKGDIPEVFLKGAGIDDTFIAYIRSLVGKPIEYYSCFLSYSSKDDAFARRLYADLQGHNVRCWFALEDLKWGERIRTGIDEAIRLHDKLLLILSKHSVSSGWVEREVKAALTREKKEKRTVLFPVRVDGAVFNSPFDWATEIRHERNIGDFTRWKSHDEYQKAFNRLLRDLKAEA